MLVYGTSKWTILNFVIINTVIKFIPLYSLRNEVIRAKDIYATIVLFAVFIFWIHLNKQSLIGNMKLIHDSLLYGKNQTPFLAFMDKFGNNFKHLNYGADIYGKQ